MNRPRILTLEEALQFINDDELVEVTPESIRLRKILNRNLYRRSKAYQTNDARKRII